MKPITTADIASELGLSVQQVRAIARARGLGTQVGGVYLFTAADLAAMRKRRPAGRPTKKRSSKR